MFCSKCGAQNNDDVKFCTSCGAQLANTQTSAAKNNPSGQSTVSIGSDLSKKIKNLSTRQKIFAVLGAIVLLAYISSLFNMRNNAATESTTKNTISQKATDIVANEAFKEVKADVYDSYAIIPILVDSNIIYHNDNDYIVVVEYKLYDDGDYVGSKAIHLVYWGGDNAIVYDKTREFQSGFDFEANLEELKAMWKLD